jgi:ornithine cyclodeaminase
MHTETPFKTHLSAEQTSLNSSNSKPSHITCTADKRHTTILTSGMIANGLHINGIGGNYPAKTKLEASLLNRADIFLVYEPQTRIESDILQRPNDSKVTEMYPVILGEKAGTPHNEQLTIFDGVGFDLKDYSALRFIFELVKQNKEAQHIELIASQKDLRNLFGLTQTLKHSQNNNDRDGQR